MSALHRLVQLLVSQGVNGGFREAERGVNGETRRCGITVVEKFGLLPTELS